MGGSVAPPPPISELIEPQTDLRPSLVWGSGAVDYKSPMWICFSSRRCHEWGEKSGGLLVVWGVIRGLKSGPREKPSCAVNCAHARHTGLPELHKATWMAESMSRHAGISGHNLTLRAELNLLPGLFPRSQDKTPHRQT
jgi:hypothetical protein